MSRADDAQLLEAAHQSKKQETTHRRVTRGFHPSKLHVRGSPSPDRSGESRFAHGIRTHSTEARAALADEKDSATVGRGSLSSDGGSYSKKDKTRSPRMQPQLLQLSNGHSYSSSVPSSPRGHASPSYNSGDEGASHPRERFLTTKRRRGHSKTGSKNSLKQVGELVGLNPRLLVSMDPLFLEERYVAKLKAAKDMNLSMYVNLRTFQDRIAAVVDTTDFEDDELREKLEVFTEDMRRFVAEMKETKARQDSRPSSGNSSMAASPKNCSARNSLSSPLCTCAVCRVLC
jgi:hypothetical protein